mmetsp:Transcript_3591/g.4883  ORF Transcript_3591/g.4883 Transcript_3591/m.4883 type:complete len:230 (+) Transcript_3591:1236-1925(+)
MDEPREVCIDSGRCKMLLSLVFFSRATDRATDILQTSYTNKWRSQGKTLCNTGSNAGTTACPGKLNTTVRLFVICFKSLTLFTSIRHNENTTLSIFSFETLFFSIKYANAIIHVGVNIATSVDAFRHFVNRVGPSPALASATKHILSDDTTRSNCIDNNLQNKFNGTRTIPHLEILLQSKTKYNSKSFESCCISKIIAAWIVVSITFKTNFSTSRSFNTSATLSFSFKE